MELTTSTHVQAVHSAYLADPFVYRAGDTFFALGTGRAEADGTPRRSSDASVFPLLASNDLVTWRAIGHALVPPDPAFGSAFWAPAVAFADGRFWLYYSVGHGESRHQLRVAVSESPMGPFVDRCALTDPDRVPFAIDPHPFQDRDGRWYLFHARDIVEIDPSEPHRAGTAIVVHALSGMDTLADDGVVVVRPRHDWQRYARNRWMYGSVYDWHTVEGPCAFLHDGRIWCLYSGGSWQGDTYGVDYVVSDRVDGPWSAPAGGESAPRVLRTIPHHLIGPGHCSVLELGDRLVLSFHAWDEKLTARRMFLADLVFTDEGPRVPIVQSQLEAAR